MRRDSTTSIEFLGTIDAITYRRQQSTTPQYKGDTMSAYFDIHLHFDRTDVRLFLNEAERLDVAKQLGALAGWLDGTATGEGEVASAIQPYEG
jgi:hypothetical protein